MKYQIKEIETLTLEVDLPDNAIVTRMEHTPAYNAIASEFNTLYIHRQTLGHWYITVLIPVKEGG